MKQLHFINDIDKIRNMLCRLVEKSATKLALLAAQGLDTRDEEYILQKLCKLIKKFEEWQSHLPPNMKYAVIHTSGYNYIPRELNTCIPGCKHNVCRIYEPDLPLAILAKFVNLPFVAYKCNACEQRFFYHSFEIELAYNNVFHIIADNDLIPQQEIPKFRFSIVENNGKRTLVAIEESVLSTQTRKLLNTVWQ